MHLGLVFDIFFFVFGCFGEEGAFYLALIVVYSFPVLCWHSLLVGPALFDSTLFRLRLLLSFLKIYNYDNDFQNQNGDSSSKNIDSNNSNTVRRVLRLRAARHRHVERAQTTAPPGVCDLSLESSLCLDFTQGR